MDKLVSVILPTYNMELYLAQCLKSITLQSYKNIEVIVVIDGATDSSFQIAKSFQDQDERFKVIWQENAGSGPARNNGLMHATGEYIMFVDPDDWIDSNMVEDLLEVAITSGADLVIAGGKTVYENDPTRNSIEQYENRLIKGRNNVREMYMDFLAEGKLGAPTSKLFKAKLIKERNIQFPDLRRSQDIVFNYRYYDVISSIYISDCTAYNYRIIEDVQNLKLKRDYYKTLSLIYSEIMELLSKWNITVRSKSYHAMCDFFMPSVMANVEANIIRKEDVEPIIQEKNIRRLVKGSRANRFDQKIFKVLYELKIKKGIEILMCVKLSLKRCSGGKF